METLLELGARVKGAAKELNVASTSTKNAILTAIAAALRAGVEEIVAANQTDLAKGREAGLSKALIDRLTLTPGRIEDIAQAVEEVAALPDPVGEVLGGLLRPNGLQITKVSVPMGVVAMIYEARPNVTVDAAALCIKSGNACILRGGKEAIHSNLALVKIMGEAIAGCGMSPDVLGFVEDTSRESALALMKLQGYVDLLIPRGGAGLIRSVVENATVPIIETGVGNCHIFVDASADLERAVAILDNAKTQRPSVCNAAETVLVHSAVAEEFLPMAKAQLDRSGVELRCCPRSLAILGEEAVPATEQDFYDEFGDYILAVKVVDSVEEATRHIEKYSSHHSDAILTNDYKASQFFVSMVDSAAVYVNASTRFTDGGEFGYGAEIGISTQKLHARGPMGLRELTTMKYIVRGDGQIR